MFSDNPAAVAVVMGQASALINSLKGFGFPTVTAGATVDGAALGHALRALRTTIDEFLGEDA